jgi:hypothetical protein
VNVDTQKVLKSYKEKKAIVEATKSRISAWERILHDPNIEMYGYYTVNKEIGMPSAHSGKSQVEREVFSVEEERELSRELVEEWIKEDKSRIFIPELEVDQIEKALMSLTTWEKYLIERKYFDNANWVSIELSFNEQFKTRNYTPFETLKNYNKCALDKITVILEPFYKTIQTLEQARRANKNEKLNGKLTTRMLTEEEQIKYNITPITPNLP